MQPRLKILFAIGLASAGVAALLVMQSRRAPEAGASQAVDAQKPELQRSTRPTEPQSTGQSHLIRPERRPLILASAPDTVRPILDRSGVPFGERLARVHRLGTELRPDEIEALYAYLEQPVPGDDDKTRGGEHVIKNDLLNRLRNQEAAPPGLARLLIQIHRDPDQDVVMRDYALQQLISWYEQVARAADPAQPAATDASRAEMEAVFWEALAETDSSIAGTALLGLHNLSTAGIELDRARLDQAAITLVRQPEAGELALITALQVCAQRGLIGVLPEVQRLAESAPSIPLQISALAALGALGSSEQAGFLEQVAAGDQTRLRPAALAALKQVRRRPRTGVRAPLNPGGGA